MELRNKKTGEIGKLQPYGEDGRIWVWVDNISKPEYRYNSLAKLNKEWEDYEKPKGWSITMYGGVTRIGKDDKPFINDLEEIGNRFNDKESVYDALEKLKAWKHLRGKRFRFKGWMIPEEPKTSHIKLVIEAEMDVPNSPYDLDLLFGGEE